MRRMLGIAAPSQTGLGCHCTADPLIGKQHAKTAELLRAAAWSISAGGRCRAWPPGGGANETGSAAGGGCTAAWRELRRRAGAQSWWVECSSAAWQRRACRSREVAVQGQLPHTTRDAAQERQQSRPANKKYGSAPGVEQSRRMSWTIAPRPSLT